MNKQEQTELTMTVKRALEIAEKELERTLVMPELLMKIREMSESIDKNKLNVSFKSWEY